MTVFRCAAAWVYGGIAADVDITVGTDGFITLSFTGLAPATKYLGAVVYGGYPGLGTTTVRIDTP